MPQALLFRPALLEGILPDFMVHSPIFEFFEFFCGYFKSFLLNRITPTMATSNRTDSISNGSR